MNHAQFCKIKLKGRTSLDTCFKYSEKFIIMFDQNDKELKKITTPSVEGQDEEIIIRKQLFDLLDENTKNDEEDAILQILI